MSQPGSSTAAPVSENLSADGTASITWSPVGLLACLSASSLLSGCCSVTPSPFFTHEAHRRGLTNSASSAVFSSFAAAQMLSFPAAGWLAPRLGVTRLFTLGLLLSGVTTVLFGLLTYVEYPSTFLAWCVTVRVAEAVGTSASLTASRTIIINQFPRRMNSAISLVEGMYGGGLCLGPALGGAMYSVGGYGAPFYTLGALILITAAASLVLMPSVTDRLDEKETCAKTKEGCVKTSEEYAKTKESCAKTEERSAKIREDDGKTKEKCANLKEGYVKKTEDEMERTDGNQEYRAMLRLVLSSADNWLICVTLFVTALNWTSMDPNIEPYVNGALGIQPAELSLFFLGSFAGYALSSPVWGRLSDTIDNTFLFLAACLAATALGVLLIPPSPIFGLQPSRLLLGVGMTLREVFQVGAYMPLLPLMVRLSTVRGLQSSVRGQALVSSICGAAYSMGNVLGPVHNLWGYPVLATGLGGVTAVLCVAMAVRGVVYCATQQAPAYDML
ncbi:uncharacterized protein LOC122364292 [Amphibalanus amphitrite]|uniref:uncharacterized protein LOC122364292 n=1 Tax=Amphibalanus amphitrite TaxID=1232801 RepID=UPI001C925059|nr:uncharacterized protein LOC122364292 [Amphibalanus amphitrite]